MSHQLLAQYRAEIKAFFEAYDKEHEGQTLTAHQIAFDEKLRYYRDLKNMLDTAAMEGKQRGIQEGIEIAKQEGEQNKAQQIARNMIANGLESALIAQLTGLTIEQIKSLWN